MRLSLHNDAGDELFDWTAPRIDFGASIKAADKLHLCFDLFVDDPKAMAKETSKRRAASR